MGNHLDAPLTEKDSHEHVTLEGLLGGATGMQGWRLEMEDAHILCDFAPEKMRGGGVHSLLAILDGHGGSGAAKFGGKNLMSHIEKQDEWKSYIDGNCNDPELIGTALYKAFLELDESLRKQQDAERDAALRKQNLEIGGGYTDTEICDTSGSTIVVCVVTPKYIVCANAGDSRCVMGSNGVTKELSFDHKPMDEEEKSRIMKAGGYVAQNRVEGNLAVSRALGDFEFKEVGRDPKETKVTAKPDIIIHERLPSDDCLVLACDGVWDVFQSNEAIDLCREIYDSGENDMKLICEELVDTALQRGSKDNISCVILRLPGAVIGDISSGGVTARRQQRQLILQQRRQQMEANGGSNGQF